MTEKRDGRILAVAIATLFAALAACSGGSGNDGVCSVEHGTYIGEDTGYLFDGPTYYCGDQGACTDFCARTSDRPDYRDCKWVAGLGSCSGDLPTPADTSMCAMELTVTCGGSPSSSTHCIACDSAKPNQSDYDATSDCLSQWGSKVGKGSTCADAEADLAK